MALTKDITCLQAVALVSDYLDGALSRRERRRLERHLSQCDACSGYLEQMRETISLTGSVGPDDLPAETLEGLVALFEQFRDDPDR